jgi:transcriptional regulator with XRE-family HTH domain
MYDYYTEASGCEFVYELYMADDDLRFDRAELREAFKLRLRIARIRAGFTTLTAAAKAVDARLPITARTYSGYETGPNVPEAMLIQQLERYFKVPPGWLLNGQGETLDQLKAALAEAQGGIGRNAKRKDVPADPAQSQDGVNQLTSNILKLDIKSSQSVPSSRIPVLLAHEIAVFLAGNGDFVMQAARMLTVPESFPVGPKVYCHVIPDDDFSMVSDDGLSFAPGDELIFDGALDVPHGKFLLIRPKGAEAWLLRRYEGGAAFSKASEFTLHALNPAVSPIRVTDRDAWEFGGRLIRRLEKF